ncbi:MAG: glyoxalase/bleomycin resistance/extradiol dioxygenase family protein [Roseateles depolymerans]|uniref:Glyoxalase/bleomycin resistance/extradiol dioxygenase family protein n=1 Tax=Roseateles depolymerans TaxID=76731 RepID=A0A2W5DNU9_9BURK|nr:MAG: glyoxalase/bleomycin resistance/extradiol dioxygenase family protein [Roseateles depolymerans]
MHQQIYVNLPVRDLAASQAFFEALGYRFNPQFTNERAACLELGENLYAMLLHEDFARSFTAKPLGDARTLTTGWVCLSCAHRERVDDLVARARAAGASIPGEPQDYGFMYGHGFEDLDGHHWELIHMSGSPADTTD